jgi:hypothetical protein
MISALLFINLKGEIIISRYYRDNVRYDWSRNQRQQTAAAGLSKHPVGRVL